MYLYKLTKEFGTCNISIELSMYHYFDEPLNLKWGCPYPYNLPGGTIYPVSHTWTLDFTCPEPCDPPCGGKGEKCSVALASVMGILSAWMMSVRFLTAFRESFVCVSFLLRVIFLLSHTM